jgi:hypothetical protein
LFSTRYGPTVRALASLEGEARDAFREDVVNS